MTREALIVIPTYLRDGRELEIVRQLLESLRATEPDAPVVLIDDASPAQLELQALDELSSRFDAGLIRKDSNDGFSATVNIGLQMALDGGLDAVLCNADIQFRSEGWLDIMQRQPKLDGDGLAEMVGALLSYPSGLIQHGGIFFCSPADEPVLTAQDGFVPIAELDQDSHGLVSYARKENRIFRCASEAGRRAPGSGRRIGGYAFERGVTHFTGDLVRIEAGRHRARVTPNHRLTVHWTEEALALHAVYLMRQGSRWRIGHTKMSHGGPAGVRGWAFGPRLRLDQQQADAVWVLSLHGSKQEAMERENLLAWKYGVPTLQFRTAGVAGLEQARLDYVWAQLDAAEGARALLAKHWRDPDLPLLVSRSHDGRRRMPVGASRRYEIAAANLMDRYMLVPTDPGSGQAPEALPLRTEREPFAGDVYSLDVPPHRHYVSGGIVVHNSFITRAFDHVHRYAPENMPEAQVPRVLPCTGALQFIRWECLREHGLYDEDFRMGFEDVDYCIRVLRAGGECVYQPLIWAYHYESLFRGQKSPKIEEWEIGSWITFRQKWAGENFARYCPSIFQ